MARSVRPLRFVVAVLVVAVISLSLTGCGADPPPRMGAVVAGDGQVTVSWQQPLAAPFPVVAFEVTPWIQHVKQTPVRFDSTATTQIVKGLRNFTAYTFTVLAINALGNDSASSESSDPVTPTGAPSPITFASFVSYPMTGGGLAVGDVNDDGVPDVVFVGSVRLGAGYGTFGAPITIPNTGSDPVLLDVNGDALVDIVTTLPTSNQVSVLRGDGTGHFGAEVRYATGAQPIRLAVGDLNGDGVLDLVTVNASSNSVSVLPGNGDGTFAAHVDHSTPIIPRSVAISDFNSDGKPDLAMAGGGTTWGEVMLGNGDGTFGTVIPFSLGVDTPGGVVAGDLNGDGHADLVIESTGLIVLLGNGDGTFVSSGVFASINSTLKLADLNGDGILDVAEVGGGGASISVGHGDGTLAFHTDFDVGGAAGDVEVSDLNGDGLPDLAAGVGASLSVLLNRPGLPLAPPFIGTVQGSDQAATVSWTAPPSNDTYPITGYTVMPQVWPSSTTLPPTTFNSAATTETVTGLTNGTRYVFRVQAINAVGVGQYSGVSFPPALVGQLPNPPTIGPAAPGDTSATVSWTAPTPVGFAVTGYRVTPYIGAVAQTPTTFNSAATTQTVTGLTNGTTYQFSVQAINAVGTGSASGLSNTVTPFAPTVPDAPTIGTAAAGNGQATVSWTAPAHDGGSPLNGYIVTPYVDGTALAPRQFFSTATTQTIKNLTNGTTYTFTVAATNGVGTGPESQHSNPVTPAP